MASDTEDCVACLAPISRAGMFAGMTAGGKAHNRAAEVRGEGLSNAEELAEIVALERKILHAFGGAEPKQGLMQPTEGVANHEEIRIRIV